MTTETATVSTTTDDDHDEQQHGASDRTYVLLALFLAAVTAGEISLSYIDVGAVMVPALIVLMIIKFVAVVSYFMHLKYEQRIFKSLFYAGVFLAISVYVLALFTFHFFG